MSQPPDVTQEEDHKKATNLGITSVFLLIFLEETEYWIVLKQSNYSNSVDHQHFETFRRRSYLKYICQ